jgi:hypothetical protein
MGDMCDSIRRRLVKLHLGKKPMVDDPEVQAHLATCPTCRLYQDHLDHDNRELEGYAESLDSYVHDVSEKLHRHSVSTPPTGAKRRTHSTWAVVLFIGCAIALVLVFTRGFDGWVYRSGTKGRSGVIEPPSSRIPNPNARIIELELRLAQQHLKQQNIPALLELLDSEFDQTRNRVAQYLAQIGDRSALPTLERLARSWQDMTVGNPYAQAIAQIEHRMSVAGAGQEDGPSTEPVAAVAPDEPNTSAPDINAPGPVTGVHSDLAVTPDAHPAAVNSLPDPPVEELVGRERTLVGRLALLGESESIPWETLELSIVRLSSGVASMPATMPENHADMSLEQLQDWCDDQALDAPSDSWRLFPPNAEGYFHCDGLTPGHYAVVGDLTPERRSDPTDQDARLWYEFRVSLGEGDSPEEPIEAGTIELLPDDLVPGDEAPGFNLQGLNEGRVRLSQYRGKLVLLSFYGSSELDEMPEAMLDLKALIEEYGQTDSFVPLGMLSSQRHVLLDRKQVERAGLSWQHVRVGRLGENRTHIDYDLLGIDRWPWHIVVAPDMTILAIGLEGDELRETLEANLP